MYVLLLLSRVSEAERQLLAIADRQVMVKDDFGASKPVVK